MVVRQLKSPDHYLCDKLTDSGSSAVHKRGDEKTITTRSIFRRQYGKKGEDK